MVVDSFQEWEARKQNGGVYRHYGRFGAATTRSFESAINTLEEGAGCMVFPSGLSACTHALLAFVETGGQVLIADNIYGPTRQFADTVLSRMGVRVDYFDSSKLEALQRKISQHTQVVFIEPVGSMTCEVSDVGAIAALAHQYGAKLLVDNSWATPLLFKPLAHGADVSIQAVTKYIGGHSDILMGTATANANSWAQLSQTAHCFGETTSPDDIYLASRGLRSLAVRLQQHQANAMALARCLENHALIAQVNHPALATHPQHAQWQRDFNGASGLFSFHLKHQEPRFIETFFDALTLFHIGLSWGGFESLILPVGQAYRSDTPAVQAGYLVRIHVGLEHIDDLQADLLHALDMAQAVLKQSATVD
jgi:cystathionine beta-lyase